MKKIFTEKKRNFFTPIRKRKIREKSFFSERKFKMEEFSFLKFLLKIKKKNFQIFSINFLPKNFLLKLNFEKTLVDHNKGNSKSTSLMLRSGKLLYIFTARKKLKKNLE